MTTSFGRIRRARFFFSLQLVILHDKFGKDGIKGQAVVSKLAEELINNALREF